MALIDTYFFVPGSISVTMLDKGNSDHRALVSVVSGTKIKLSASLDSSISYAKNLDYRTWTIVGANTRFSSAYMYGASDANPYALRVPIYIYIRVEANDISSTGQLIFSPYEYTIGGKVFTTREGSDLLSDVIKEDTSEIYVRSLSVEKVLAEQNGTVFDDSTPVRRFAPANVTTDGTSYQKNFLYIRIGKVNTDDSVDIPNGTLGTDYGQERKNDSELEKMFRLDTSEEHIVPQKPFSYIVVDGSITWGGNSFDKSILSTDEYPSTYVEVGADGTYISGDKYLMSAAAIDKNYLHKYEDDSTNYNLTVGGLTVDKQIQGYDISINPDTGEEIRTPIYSDAELNFGQDFEEGTTGAKIWNTGDGWKIQTDYLTVTKKAIFETLEVMHTSHIGGKLMLTAADATLDYVAKCTYQKPEIDNTDPDNPVSVIVTHTFYRCFFKKTDEERIIYNKWKLGDIAYYEEFNVSQNYEQMAEGRFANRYVHADVIGLSGSAGIYDKFVYSLDENDNLSMPLPVPSLTMVPADSDTISKAEYTEGVTTNSEMLVFFKKLEETHHFIDLSGDYNDANKYAADADNYYACAPESDAPHSGDYLAQLGNKTNEGRQGTIILAAVDGTDIYSSDGSYNTSYIPFIRIYRGVGTTAYNTDINGNKYYDEDGNVIVNRSRFVLPTARIDLNPKDPKLNVTSLTITTRGADGNEQDLDVKDYIDNLDFERDSLMVINGDDTNEPTTTDSFLLNCRAILGLTSIEEMVGAFYVTTDWRIFKFTAEIDAVSGYATYSWIEDTDTYLLEMLQQFRYQRAVVDSVLSDNIITPDEKTTFKLLYQQIEQQYTKAHSRLLSLGTSSDKLRTLENTFNALKNMVNEIVDVSYWTYYYCLLVSGNQYAIVQNTSNITILTRNYNKTRADINEIFSKYYEAYEAANEVVTTPETVNVENLKASVATEIKDNLYQYVKESNNKSGVQGNILTLEGGKVFIGTDKWWTLDDDGNITISSLSGVATSEDLANLFVTKYKADGSIESSADMYAMVNAIPDSSMASGYRYESNITLSADKIYLDADKTIKFGDYWELDTVNNILKGTSIDLTGTIHATGGEFTGSIMLESHTSYSMTPHYADGQSSVLYEAKDTSGTKHTIIDYGLNDISQRGGGYCPFMVIGDKNDSYEGDSETRITNSAFIITKKDGDEIYATPNSISLYHTNSDHSLCDVSCEIKKDASGVYYPTITLSANGGGITIGISSDGSPYITGFNPNLSNKNIRVSWDDYNP